MNSHAIFTSLDPHHPASLSSVIHADIIRGKLGFDGLLLSDDLAMKALNGAPDDLAQRALAAGSDVVLHCDGNLAAMNAIARALGPMRESSLMRWRHALAMRDKPDPLYRPAADIARLDILLGAEAYEEDLRHHYSAG